jgi:hypothetical protein
MSMQGGGQRLMALTRELLRNWEATKEHWRDAKSREFEQRFIEVLVNGVHAASPNIERVERIVNKVRSDCE